MLLNRKLQRISIILFISCCFIYLLYQNIKLRDSYCRVRPKRDINSSDFSNRQVIYNRVPKCGSSLTKEILRRLSHKNSFQLHESDKFHHAVLKKAQEEQLVDAIEGWTTPLVYERHVHFIDFTKYGYEMPTYINLIRDPLNRLVSAYYFGRFHPNHRLAMEENVRNMTFDVCVSTDHPECANITSYFVIVPYFCGQQRFCRHPSKKALYQAMDNVNKYYKVVGFLEDVRSFYELCEVIIPDIFKGAVELFKTFDGKPIVQQNKRKITPSEATKELMKTKLSEEYEFYNFIKQKFYLEYQKIFDSEEELSKNY